LLVIQKVPEFVERYMKPGDEVAAIFVPSAEQATEFQFVLGALVCVQVWANEEPTTIISPQQMIAAVSKFFIGCSFWVCFSLSYNELLSQVIFASN
jgi:hypothetical protein